MAEPWPESFVTVSPRLVRSNFFSIGCKYTAMKVNHSRHEIAAFEKGYRCSGGRVIGPSGKQLSMQITELGYPRFSIRIDGKTVPIRAHRLSAYQAFGDAIYADGIVVRHKDANRLNFSQENLALGSQSENMMDVNPEIRLRNSALASRKSARLNHSEIIAFYNSCRSYSATMDRFGISSKGTLNFILTKSTCKKEAA